MTHSFCEIRRAYSEVYTFLSKYSHVEAISLDIKIEEDLGLWGIENEFLLMEFVEKYDLNFDAFQYDHHFQNENNGCIFVLLLPICLPLLLIERIGRLVFPSLKFPFLSHFDEKADLTFGDLIACYLAGKFCLRKDANIRLV